MIVTKFFTLLGCTVVYVILLAVRWVQGWARKEEDVPLKGQTRVRVLPEQEERFRQMMEEISRRRTGRPWFDQSRRARGRAGRQPERGE